MKASDFQVFLRHVYVLNAKIQGRGNIKKWKFRSRLGVYIGHSKIHAGNLVLVLNHGTINVSTQHHVVFDNGFTTVGVNDKQTKEAMDTQLENLFISKRWNFCDKFEDNVTSRHHFDAIWDANDKTDAVVESVEPQPKSTTATEIIKPAS